MPDISWFQPDGSEMSDEDWDSGFGKSVAVYLPDQADRWTWLITAAYTQLRLARPLVADQRLPWEKPAKPNKLTPVRVRRGFRRLAATLGTPANPPKPSKAGPGRPKGTRRGPRTRHPAIKKTA